MELDTSRFRAQQCRRFQPDDEDEQVDDQLRSCVNCAYRRWLASGYLCCHPKITSPPRVSD
ncbi:hypothetical protein [Ferrimonas sp. YFM]|uniref:hypothetical protein n=1 Tax=Ferrimonas sp. YFM TaxID=3028878 RepID=UPI0025741470|nr:hypothetical protein [Ferrimonas sp. YFM]BDY06841.1 hypothetical protein F0521_38820 [Ferrimonas sp. YFM]